MSEEIIYVVVKVDALIPEAKLPSDDTGVVGIYAFEFYANEAKPLDADGIEHGLDIFEEHALDLFHDMVGISELDNFDISADRVETLDNLPEGAEYHQSTAIIFGYIPGTSNPKS